MPDLLDGFDLEPERLRQRLLGKSSVDPDPKLAEREFQKCEAARRVEMVEHRGEHARCIHFRGGAQAIDRVADPNGRIVRFGDAGRRRRPEEGDGFRAVSDIVAAHRKEDRIDPLSDNASDRGRLHMRDVERAGQRRETVAAVRIRRFIQIIADQLELGVARASIDEIVKQLRKGAHCAL